MEHPSFRPIRFVEALARSLCRDLEISYWNLNQCEWAHGDLACGRLHYRRGDAESEGQLKFNGVVLNLHEGLGGGFLAPAYGKVCHIPDEYLNKEPSFWEQWFREATEEIRTHKPKPKAPAGARR